MPSVDEETRARLRGIEAGRAQQKATATASPKKESTGFPSVSEEDRKRLASLERQRQEQAAAVKKEEPVQKEQEKTSSVLNSLFPVGELALSALTSGASSAAGGFAGLVDLILGGSLDEAVSTVKSTQASLAPLTYTPKTQSAQLLGEGLSRISAPIEKAKEFVGEKTLETTGSPLAATAAYMAPELIGSAFGLKNLVRKEQARSIEKATVDADISQRLQDPTRRYDSDLATVYIDNKGKVATSQVGEALVNSGVKEQSVSQVMHAPVETKQVMSRMLDKFEQAETNDLIAATAPLDSEIGMAVTQRLSTVKKMTSDYVQELDSIVAGRKGNTPVSLAGAVDGFLGRVAKELNLELKVLKNGRILLPKKTTGLMATTQMAPSRSLIKDIIRVYNTSKANKGSVPASVAHRLKKELDTLVNANKASIGGLSNEAQRIALELRQTINEAIRDTPGMEDYAKVNDNLSAAYSSVEPFKKYLAKGESWDSTKTNSIVANAVKNIGEDTTSIQALKQDLTAMENFLTSRGKVMNVDPIVLAQFKRTLRDTFRVTENDILANVKKADEAISSNVLDGLSSLAVGNKFGAVHDLNRITKGTIKKKELEKILKNKRKIRYLLAKALDGQHL